MCIQWLLVVVVVSFMCHAYRPGNAVLAGVQDRVHRQFRYILVDEFQDTTTVQMQVSVGLVWLD